MAKTRILFFQIVLLTIAFTPCFASSGPISGYLGKRNTFQVQVSYGPDFYNLFSFTNNINLKGENTSIFNKRPIVSLSYNRVISEQNTLQIKFGFSKSGVMILPEKNIYSPSDYVELFNGVFNVRVVARLLLLVQ